MKRCSIVTAFVMLVGLATLPAAAREPVRLILDTDIGNDIDDTLALAMIHALQNRDEVKLLAVTITKDNKFAPRFVALVNAFYGRADIPVGLVRNGKTPEDSPMLRIPVERLPSAGRIEAAPIDAVTLLTRTLSEQPDHSVTVAQIGFSTNLARLLRSNGGLDLISRKVKMLYLMAGSFATQNPEYNIYTDADSAKILLEEWPTPMVLSPFEVGIVITYPYKSIEDDFGYVDDHPIAEAFRIFTKKPEDRANYDSTAVLEAIRPDRGYFALSPPGRVTLGPKATTIFTLDASGKCRYLMIKPDQVSRIRELVTALVSEPPQCLKDRRPTVP